MKKIEHLDELQLLKRGNIFKHGLFSLVGLLLVNTLLYSCGIEWAAGKWAELTITLFVIVLCSIEFICYDIYPLTEKRQKYLIYFSGLFGLASIIACVYDLLTEKTGMIVEGKIANDALGIIYGLMFSAVFLAYKIKTRHNLRTNNNEEDK